jgi:hypothetical protein
VTAKSTSDSSQLTDADYEGRATAQVALWFGDWNHRALLDHLTRVGIYDERTNTPYASVGEEPLNAELPTWPTTLIGVAMAAEDTQ